MESSGGAGAAEDEGILRLFGRLSINEGGPRGEVGSDISYTLDLHLLALGNMHTCQPYQKKRYSSGVWLSRLRGFLASAPPLQDRLALTTLQPQQTASQPAEQPYP